MSKSIASALVGLTVAFLGVIIVSYLATTQWMTPYKPIRIVTIAVLLPMVVFGLMIAMPGEGEAWTPKTVIAGAGPGTLFGIIGMIVVSAWTSPSVRIGAIDWFEGDKTRLVLALGDRDPNVSASACAALLNYGPGGFRGALMEAARSRPEMAALCLEKSKDMDRGPGFSARLMGQWEHDLLVGKMVSDNPCDLPGAVAAIPVKKLDREQALLACFFRSQNTAMRQCCATNLGVLVGTGEAFVTQISGQTDMLVESGLLKDIAAVSFGTSELSKKELAAAQVLGLGPEASQRPIFDAVCKGISQIEQPSDVTKYLAASLDGRCAMDTTAIPRGRGAWAVICEQTQTLLSEHPDLSAVEALCVGVEGMSRVRAIRVASGLVEGAVEGKRKFGQMGAAIAVGFAMEGDPSENARKLQLDTFVDQLRSDPNLSAAGKDLIDGMGDDIGDAMVGRPMEQIQEVIGSNPEAMGVTQEQAKGLKAAQKRLRNLPTR